MELGGPWRSWETFGGEAVHGGAGWSSAAARVVVGGSRIVVEWRWSRRRGYAFSIAAGERRRRREAAPSYSMLGGGRHGRQHEEAALSSFVARARPPRWGGGVGRRRTALGGGGGRRWVAASSGAGPWSQAALGGGVGQRWAAGSGGDFFGRGRKERAEKAEEENGRGVGGARDATAQWGPRVGIFPYEVGRAEDGKTGHQTHKIGVGWESLGRHGLPNTP